jgi:hypothetical protein
MLGALKGMAGGLGALGGGGKVAKAFVPGVGGAPDAKPLAGTAPGAAAGAAGGVGVHRGIMGRKMGGGGEKVMGTRGALGRAAGPAAPAPDLAAAPSLAGGRSASRGLRGFASRAFRGGRR